MKTFKRISFFVLFLLTLISCISLYQPSVSAAAMNDYCVNPPFVVGGVRPNLLMVLDNSASMFDLTYTSSVANSYCYDNTYDNAKTYIGYFSKIDLDTGAVTYPVYSYLGDRFVEGAAIPAVCTYGGTASGNPYVCVNIAGGVVTNFIASGKFLNWLATSKIDVQKLVLTGGKYDTVNGYNAGEGRGCNGRRFIKEVKKPDGTDLGIVFAARGPFAQEPDFVNPDTQGGFSRIEIYEGNYNQAACQDAVDSWVNDPLGQWLNASRDCFGIGGGAGTATGRELATFIEASRDCYHIKENIKAGLVTPDLNGLFKNVTPNNLMTQCDNVYTKDCPDPDNIAACVSPTIDLNDPQRGNYLCSGAANHLDPSAPHYNSLGSDNTGFVGKCWNGAAGKFTGNEACVLRELLHFCSGVGSTEVIDPSEGSGETAATGNISPFIIDAGARTLGDPKGTFFVRASTQAPEGIINQFSNLIRFGVMSFNCLGSASEGVPGTCKTGPNLDAGRVLPNAHIGDPVGDHSSGLIKAIDDNRAESWTPFSEAFYNAIGYYANRTDLRLNAADFDDTKNPSQFRCQANYVLLISDGMSTADRRIEVNALASSYNDGDGQTGWTATCPEFSGSRNLDDLAWLAKNRNIKDFTKAPTQLSDWVSTWTIFTGSANAALPGECNPKTLMQQTAANGGGKYFEVSDPAQFFTSVRSMFSDVAARTASGTAASVLASGEGSGANLVQALFYPKRNFGTKELEWSGSLKNLWYYIDPFLGSSNIREDSSSANVFNLKDDYIVRFRFDSTTKQTYGDLYEDTDGDGDADSARGTVGIDDVKVLFEAGKKLWSTNPNSRTLYTTRDTSSLITFTTDKASQLRPHLQAATDAEADAVIRYIRGEDFAGLRDRTVTIGGTSSTWKLGDIVNSTPRIISWVPNNLYFKSYNDKTYKKFTESPTYTSRGMVFTGSNDGMLHAFRLGTVNVLELDFTKAEMTGSDFGKEEWAFIPKNMLPYLKYLASPNYCHLFYIDATPYVFDASIGGDPDSVKPEDGSSWRTVLIGGMRFGGACRKTGDACSECTRTPILDPDDATGTKGLGYSSYFALDITDPASPKLLWEFSNDELGYSTSGPAIIRVGDGTKNGKWFAVFSSGPTGWVSPAIHQFVGITYYYLDGAWFQQKLFVVDVKTGNLVRTINTWNNASFSGNLINSSIDFDQDYQDDALYFGYTSYNWDDSGIASPTGTAQGGTSNTITLAATASATDNYYKGLFIDTWDGAYYRTKMIVSYDGTSKIATVDIEWATLPTSATLYWIFPGWNRGGVMRLVTKESTSPGNWDVSHVAFTPGPVTAAVTKLQNFKDSTLRLYFGTGRFFYRITDVIDDASNARRLYGIKEPCFDETGLDTACSTSVGDWQLTEAATGAGTTDSDGWYINLDSCTDAGGAVVSCDSSSSRYKAERVVTDPLATFQGAVFFTTTKPSADICEYGGGTHLWAVQYDTGGKVKTSMRGKALVQVSTGSIEEVDLATAFKETPEGKEGRRSDMMQGVPPAGSPPGIIVSPPPMKKIIHIKEK